MLCDLSSTLFMTSQMEHILRSYLKHIRKLEYFLFYNDVKMNKVLNDGTKVPMTNLEKLVHRYGYECNTTYNHTLTELAQSTAYLPLHARNPSPQVNSKLVSPTSPQAPNQAPPFAQQLSLPVLGTVPQVGHTEEVFDVDVGGDTPVGIHFLNKKRVQIIVT